MKKKMIMVTKNKIKIRMKTVISTGTAITKSRITIRVIMTIETIMQLALTASTQQRHRHQCQRSQGTTRRFDRTKTTAPYRPLWRRRCFGSGPRRPSGTTSSPSRSCPCRKGCSSPAPGGGEGGDGWGE